MDYDPRTLVQSQREEPHPLVYCKMSNIDGPYEVGMGPWTVGDMRPTIVLRLFSVFISS